MPRGTTRAGRVRGTTSLAGMSPDTPPETSPAALPDRPARPVNVSFELLDRAVVLGRADEPVLGGTSHARLLEEVAALGGVLHHLGVGRGTVVPVDLEQEADAVVAALAVARLGGVVQGPADERDADQVAAAPVLVAATGSPLLDRVPGAGQVRLLRAPAGQGPVVEPDLDWQVMIRAGRTDPAACELVDPSSAYSPGRAVAAVLEDLAATRAPYADGELRRLLGV